MKNATAVAIPAETATSKRVYVHDHEASVEKTTAVLERLGYVAVAGGGEPADEACAAALIGAAFDPDFTLSRMIAQTCPVILVSDDTTFEHRLAAARAGVEAILTPPLDMVELGAWLAEFEDAGEETFVILVVDDDELAAHSHALTLEAAGMCAHVVTDPAKVPEMLVNVTPDLVLLDMHMPGASGIEVARIIRQSRRHLSVPIMFLSGERDLERQQIARRIGGDDFISKPIEPSRLATLVRMRAARAVALRQVMECDSLTGLLNHARFKDRLGVEIERSNRTGSPLSVCLVDLDHFKRVNDTHGHQAGDRVIQTLAHTLTGRLRKIDVIARYGGEEFAVLMLDTKEAGAAATLDEIRRTFSQIAFGSDDAPFFVTLSAGVASAPPGTPAEKLVAAADQALYQAKAQGRDQVVIYEA